MLNSFSSYNKVRQKYGEELIIHPRIMQRHPNIKEEDVIDAWQSMMVHTYRIDTVTKDLVAVGTDSKGRILEMVARILPDKRWCVFHAMTPPSAKTKLELGIGGRGGK